MYDAGLSREAIFGRTCTTLVLKGLTDKSIGHLDLFTEYEYDSSCDMHFLQYRRLWLLCAYV